MLTSSITVSPFTGLSYFFQSTDSFIDALGLDLSTTFRGPHNISHSGLTLVGKQLTAQLNNIRSSGTMKFERFWTQIIVRRQPWTFFFFLISQLEQGKEAEIYPPTLT